MNVDLHPLEKAAEPMWKQIKVLFTEHHFITIVCAFFVLMLTLSCYRFLKSISPALVVLICLIVLVILLMHWTATRSEPEFLTPFVDYLAPFFPSVAPVPTTPKH